VPLLLIEINVVVSYDSYYLRELQFNEANKTTIAVLTTTVRVMDFRKTCMYNVVLFVYLSLFQEAAL